MSLKKLMKPVWKAGFQEKNAALPDGTLLHYAEGPENGNQPLLLIHGQTGAWQDYASVLPKLCKAIMYLYLTVMGTGNPPRVRKSIQLWPCAKILPGFCQRWRVVLPWYRVILPAVCWLRTWQRMIPLWYRASYWRTRRSFLQSGESDGKNRLHMWILTRLCTHFSISRRRLIGYSIT